MASKREVLAARLLMLEGHKRRTIEKFDELIERHQRELALLSESEGDADANELGAFELPPLDL